MFNVHSVYIPQWCLGSSQSQSLSSGPCLSCASPSCESHSWTWSEVLIRKTLHRPTPPCGISEESVHDEPSLRIHALGDREEGHGVLNSPDDHLKIGIPYLGQENVQPRPFLKPPPMLMTPVWVDQEAGHLQDNCVLWLVIGRLQWVWQKLVTKWLFNCLFCCEDLVFQPSVVLNREA